ncbi:pyridoxal phosphate-dependent aminotransferase [Sphingomonas sp. URHD0057]|uniref:pyridoxal phosphate-dependent aminotransferase n=1 Tax=Sphingomonas sp. URHD0057 TaxID=1380389 RepID=UPI0004913ECA|nr:pyridoxal phosphate-dependent aminotransferase [Sphingomonas sp. URHD0057]
MRATGSDYMHWAKFKPPVRFALTASEVPHFRMDSLPIAIADLDMDGASHPRYPPLREAIARRYGVAAEQVAAADGTSMANFLAMAALIAPGDEVLVERPTYEPLLGIASFLGAEIKRFDRRAEDRFRIDVDRVAAGLSERTRLIVITNLHNPSSALADEAELGALAKLARKTNARVLVDEVYLDSAVPARRSAAHLGPEFVCTNSLTKVYGLSGLRCGWILAEPELAERMWRLNDLFGVNQAHQAEMLACIAFERLDEILGQTPAMLGRNRALFDVFVAGRPDLECMPAEHGIVAFPRWTGNTEPLAAHLREHQDTAVVPGSWFEMPDHFRVGLGVPTDLLEGGLKRLGAALDDLQ